MEELKLIRPGEIRVRMAPSPTGPMHLGFARTALFNYLFAEKYQGTLILRIDDTDIQRSQKKWEKDIIEGLNWLGLEFQEGPGVDGKFGPYRQSERKEIYQKYLQKLLDEKKIYYCFCSPEELEAHRNYLLSIGQPPRYSEKCAELSEREIEENLKNKKSYVLRFRMSSKKVRFKDLLRGEIEYDSQNFGDIVVAKNLAAPLYNLTSVIDDFEMKITHIIRGEEHIPNTPIQILLAEALGIKTPQYLHLPLIFGLDRAKLSKRDRVKSILEYKEEGYLSVALINFLALLGWNPGANKEIFSLLSLIQEFSVEKIQKSGAVFNPQKLDWLNGFYIRQKSLDKLTEDCIPYLIKTNLIKPCLERDKHSLFYEGKVITTKFETTETGEGVSFYELMKIIDLYQARLKKFSEISELIDFFFKKKLDYSSELLRWKEMSNEEIKEVLDKLSKTLNKLEETDWTKKEIGEVLLKLAGELGKEDRGYLLWPLRAALSGKTASAGPFEIAELLGKEKTLERIRMAKEKIKI